MAKDSIYFDNNATTKIDPRVLKLLVGAYETSYANPSAREHEAGEQCNRLVRKALGIMAKELDCSPNQLTVTSGASESLNQILNSLCTPQASKPVRLLVNPLEHKAVLSTCKYLVECGRAEVSWLENNKNGEVSLSEIAAKAPICDAVVVMAANNELGTVYPVEEIGKIAEDHSCAYVCDASQAIGKIPFSFKSSRASYLVGSSHKFYGPKGIGFTISRDPNSLTPLIYGGGQQDSRRSGTLDLPSIVAMAGALEIATLEGAEERERIRGIRDYIQTELLRQVPEAIVLASAADRLPGTLAVSFRGVPNDAIVARVSDRLAISTGSACTVGVEEPSHVYSSLGLSTDIVVGMLRISVGRFNTLDEGKDAVDLLVRAAKDTRCALSDEVAA